jgi:hypothetical protein
MQSYQKVAYRYELVLKRRKVAFEASNWAIRNTPYSKTSSTKVARELNVRVLSVFGEAMLRHASPNKTALVKMLGKKLKELYQAFRKAPKLWMELKKKLGIVSTNTVKIYLELSKKFQELLDNGKKWWDNLKKKLSKDSMMLKFLFMYASNAPTLTSVVEDIVSKYGGKAGDLGKWLSKVVGPMAGKARNVSQWLDSFLAKHPLLKLISWPAKAYIYWIIWINVAEISWKVTDLLKGFLGMISWTDLLDSLPESGVGFLVAMIFPGIPGGMLAKSLKIGWNAILAPAVGFQLYALYKKGLVDENGQPTK